MSPILALESYAGWHNFGKRYLHLGDFISLCDAVGLYGCAEHELEEYERNCWMFATARMVMPEEYAQSFWKAMYSPNSKIEFDEEFLPFHELDQAIRYQIRVPNGPEAQDLRHPIDRAWNQVVGLEKPIEEEYVPWESYEVVLDISGLKERQTTVTHFYHYWQIYELYHVRRFQKGMYKDNTPMLTIGGPDLRALLPFLDAVSYFQHLYQSRRSRMFDDLQADDDGWVQLDQAQQNELEQAARQYAVDTLQTYGFDEDGSFVGLRQTMQLHDSYEKSERNRLAEALKTDLWRTVEFIHFASDTQTDDVAIRAGRVGGYVEDYLELLFPNRRQQARDKALKIVRNLAQEHNRHAPNYPMSVDDLQEFLDYVESTDLAWFEYVMVELNRAHFARHSWRTAEAILHLKALASFPESLMKTLILRNGDAVVQRNLQNQQSPGMGNLNDLVFGSIRPSILAEYQIADHWNAREAAEFARNLSHLIPLISVAPTEETYLGVNLALATLLRNFTSHLVVEDPQLLQGQYVRCVRAILTAAFSAWNAAKRKGWI